MKFYSLNFLKLVQKTFDVSIQSLHENKNIIKFYSRLYENE